MSGLIGADPQQLNDFARQMEQSAKSLEQSRNMLLTRFSNTSWTGRDAQRARAEFKGSQAPALSRAAVLLRETAEKLRKNAQEQESASSSGSLSGGSGAAGGSGGTSASSGSGGSAGSDASASGLLAAAKAASADVPGTSIKMDSNTDGTKTQTVTVDSTTGHKESTELGKVPGLGSLTAEAGVQVKSSFELQTSQSKEWDTYKVTSKFQVEASGGLDLKKWGLEGKLANGDQFSYQLKVPSGTDPTTINPNDPSTWPPGTQITIEGAKTSNGSLTLKYGPASLDSSVSQKDGTTRIITSNPDGTVTVKEGPTSSIKNAVTLQAGTDDLKASFTLDKSLSDSTLKSANFDPKDPAGAAALREAANGGNLPSSDGPGVSKVETVQTIEFSQNKNAALKAYDFTGSVTDSSGNQKMVVTTYGDGSSDIESTRVLPGAPDLVRTVSLDANGQADTSSTRYTFSLDKISDWDAQVLTQGELSGVYGKDVSAGDNVKLTFTQAQLDNYYAQAQAQFNDEGQIHKNGYALYGGEPKEQFIFGLQNSANNGQGMVADIWDFSQSGNGDTPVKFPGTVSKAD